MVRNPFSAPVYYLPSTGSTMIDARKHVQGGSFCNGTVYWAGEQTAGCGRLPGRIWVAHPGCALLFTVILKKTGWQQGVAPSLLAACGVTAALSANKLKNMLAIKWPNDIYLNGKKIAGILTEAVGSELLLVGIGINVLSAPENTVLRNPAGFLAESCSPPPLAELLSLVLGGLHWSFSRTPREIHSYIAPLLLYQDQPVSILMPDNTKAVGRLTGVGLRGEAVVHTGDRVISVACGEMYAW